MVKKEGKKGKKLKKRWMQNLGNLFSYAYIYETIYFRYMQDLWQRP